ncbi:AbrB family transcriptional regulator [Falsigemmobacter faecalis]|uniref:AbrB family transcriptional regulator n=1 Tax=Falsigemmobacter faecalis TaxID=2488730 RepID=A0A3P3DDI8_9RHOB|nr:AbrB family transcriptional regulator [Falsigemmobacter faecalis]RRH72385.1 AbrB family transcriptional regulator [Falsigemmobacter faecalis]
MKRPGRIWGEVSPRTALGTLALALCGGALAAWLALPLAWLLGSVFVVGLAAVLGISPGPGRVDLPPIARSLAIPLLGAGIGAGFTPEVVAGMPQWWVTILALGLYLPLLHQMVYRILRRSAHLSEPTAFYAAVPGGLVESVQMGEAAGGDVQMMTLLHLLRMIACVLLIPPGLALVSGQDLSRLPVSPQGADLAWWRAAAELIVISLAGAGLGHLLRLPAAVFFGPLLMSALAHATGLSTATLSPLVIIAAQVVIGAGLGAKFVAMSPRLLLIALRLTLFTSLASGTLAIGFALALSRLAGVDGYAVFLAYAPGGIIEMSLIAMSMQLNPIFVSSHHLLRIVFALIGVRLMAPATARPPVAGTHSARRGKAVR